MSYTISQYSEKNFSRYIEQCIRRQKLISTENNNNSIMFSKFHKVIKLLFYFSIFIYIYINKVSLNKKK